jgi:hypothetical protein
MTTLTQPATPTSRAKRRGRFRADRLAASLDAVGAARAREDATALVRLATDGRPAVQRAAVRALGELTGADAQAALLAVLAGPRADASGAARDLLATQCGGLRDRLWELFVAAADARVDPRRRYVRANVVALFARGERLVSLTNLLWACALGDVDVREQAVRAIRAWGVYWPPAGPVRQVLELAAALREAEPALPAPVADELWRFVTFRTGWTPPRRRPRADAAPAKAKASEPPDCSWTTRTVRRRYVLAPTWRARVWSAAFG